MFKVWVNTSLGETWEEKGDAIESDPLYQRREIYGPEIPARACILIAGVDVQADRLEVQEVAWGPGFESWAIDYRIFRGDTLLDDVWQDLDAYLVGPRIHALGVWLYISSVFVDSGFQPEVVYRYTKSRQARRVFASKGQSSPGATVVTPRPSLKNVAKAPVYYVGTDTAKDHLYARLRLDEPGPEYIHFPKTDVFNEDYFKQLTAEEVRTKYINGNPVRYWTLKTGARNEALDTMIYSMAALALLRPKFETIMAMIEGEAEKQNKRATEPKQSQTPVVRGGRRVISKGVEI